MNGKLTTSAKRTVLIFDEFIRKDGIIDGVKELRKELNLPPDGIPFTDEDKKACSDPFDTFLYIPKRAQEKFNPADKEDRMRVIRMCNGFTRQHGYSSIFIDTLFRFYVFFNQTMDIAMGMFDNYNDYIRIEYLPSELSLSNTRNNGSIRYAYEHFVAVSKKNPIAMFINPEVSQRELQDFISKNWSFFKAHKGKSKVKTYREKDKSVQERNDFIYQNKSLPRKKIMMLVTDKYGADNTIDYAYIGKIISLENYG